MAERQTNASNRFPAFCGLEVANPEERYTFCPQVEQKVAWPSFRAPQFMQKDTVDYNYDNASKVRSLELEFSGLAELQICSVRNAVANFQLSQSSAQSAVRMLVYPLLFQREDRFVSIAANHMIHHINSATTVATYCPVLIFKSNRNLRLKLSKNCHRNGNPK